MKTEKMNAASLIVMFIIFVGFLSVCYQLCAKNIIYEKIGYDAKWFLATIQTDDNFDEPTKADVVWSEEYPYSTEEYEQLEISYTEKETEKAVNYNWRFSEIIAKIYSILEKYTADYFTFTDYCEYISRQFNNCIGFRLNEDAYGTNQLFLSNGHMTYERKYVPMDSLVYNMVNFENWLESKDIKYFHVVIPDPVSPEEEILVQSRGYKVYSNQMADELVAGLRNAGIDCYDLREYFEADGNSYTEGFFKYEHHMLPETGLWAAGRVSEHINEITGLQSDRTIFDVYNYNVTSVDKSSEWLNDKYVVYKGTENLDLLHPKFATDIKKYVADYDLEIQGSFDDTMYSLWDLPTYNTWNHGIRAIKTYRNNLVEDENIKILLLTESYSDVISPFIACAYSNVDEVDLRIFTGSLKTFIEETKPDLIISMYSAYDLGSGGAEELFEFK